MCASLPLISGSCLWFLSYTHQVLLLLSPPVTHGEGSLEQTLTSFQGGWARQEQMRPHWNRGHLSTYMSPHRGGKYLGVFRAGQAETLVKGPPGLSFSEKAQFLGLWPLLAFEWRHWLFLREDG